MTCEDFPCCGHERGSCPDFDESGQQTNMRCVCGAVVMLGSSVSLCGRCMREMGESIEDPEVPQVNEERHWGDPYDDE